MSLTEQLATQKAQSLANFPEDVKNRLLGDLDDLGQSGMVDRAPKEGDQLKDFVLINHLGEERNLASLRANGPVVITFYRGGWCPYCNLELRAYQAVLGKYRPLVPLLWQSHRNYQMLPCQRQRKMNSPSKF